MLFTSKVRTFEFLKYVFNLSCPCYIIVSIIEVVLLTGTKTAFIQYRKREIVHGFIFFPIMESSLTRQTCLE